MQSLLLSSADGGSSSASASLLSSCATLVEQLATCGLSQKFAATISASPAESSETFIALSARARFNYLQLKIANACAEVALALSSRAPDFRVAVVCADEASARTFAAVAIHSAIEFDLRLRGQYHLSEAQSAADGVRQADSEAHAQVKLSHAVAVDTGLGIPDTSSRIFFTTAEAIFLRLISPRIEFAYHVVVLCGLPLDDVCMPPLISWLSRDDSPPCLALASCFLELPPLFKQLQRHEIYSVDSIPSISHSSLKMADVLEVIAEVNSSSSDTCLVIITDQPLLSLSNKLRALASTYHATLPHFHFIQPSISAKKLASIFQECAKGTAFVFVSSACILECCALPNVTEVIDMRLETDPFITINAANLQFYRVDSGIQRSSVFSQKTVLNSCLCGKFCTLHEEMSTEQTLSSLYGADLDCRKNCATSFRLVLQHAIAGANVVSIEKDSSWFNRTSELLIKNGLISNKQAELDASGAVNLQVNDLGATTALLKMTPLLSSFFLECSDEGLFLEGLLAVSLASIENQFWLTPSDFPDAISGPRRGGEASGYRHDDEALKSIVSSVVKDCIDILKCEGVTSDKNAMSLSSLGRKLSESVGLKLPKDLKLRSILKSVDGIVFCGELNCRAVPSVYYCEHFDNSVALQSSMQTHVDILDRLDQLRQSSDLSAGICALLYIWLESADTPSKFQKLCRKLSVHPSSCTDVVQRVNSLLQSIWSTDSRLLPKSLIQDKFVQQLKSKSYSELQTDSSATFKFLPVFDDQSIRCRAVSCSTSGSQALAALCRIAASNFSVQTFEIYTAFGEQKCRIFSNEGLSMPASTFIKPGLSDFKSYQGTYMNSIPSTTGNTMDIICAVSDPTVSTNADFLRAEVICAPSLAIDKLQSDILSDSLCIVSRTSPMELSVYGPNSIVSTACLRIRKALAEFITELAAVPRIMGQEIGMLEGNHRVIFGPGFNVMSILSPSESNVLQIHNVCKYLTSVTKNKHWLKMEGHKHAKIVLQAFKEICLDRVFPPPFSENHPVSVEVVETHGQQVISITFNSSFAANCARSLLSQLDPSKLLYLFQNAPAISLSNPGTSIRIAFSVLNLKQISDLQSRLTFVKEKVVNGRKYFSVGMSCCNSSGWHKSARHPVIDIAESVSNLSTDVVRCTPECQSGSCKHLFSEGASSSFKPAFVTHNAFRRTHVKRGSLAGRPHCEEYHRKSGMWIPHEVFAHSGHKCLMSEGLPCPFTDGPHRLTFDHLPRWSCCDAPYVEHDSNTFCDQRPRKPFDSFCPDDLFHLCWETHYFLSQSDALRAAESISAKTFRESLAALREKMDQIKAKKASAAQQISEVFDSSDDHHDDSEMECNSANVTDKGTGDENKLIEANELEYLIAKFHNSTRTTNYRYLLKFGDTKMAREAKNRITHSRQLQFSLDRTGRKFIFVNVKLRQKYIVFNIAIEHQGIPVPIPNRHLLLGILKHWGCRGIERLEVMPEAIDIVKADAFLNAINRTVENEIKDAMQKQGIPMDSFSVIGDPYTATRGLQPTAHSFQGLYGHQMLSFVVQMHSSENFNTLIQELQSNLLGSVRMGLFYKFISYDLVCCEVRPDTSKFFLLPSNANSHFLDSLKWKLQNFVSSIQKEAPESMINWAIGTSCSPTAESNRSSLVIESGDMGLVDQAYRFVHSYVIGHQVPIQPCVSWWFHSQEALEYVSKMKALADENGICVAINSNSSVTFYGSIDLCHRYRDMLQARLEEVLRQSERCQVEISVNFTQLNRFIKRHGSLKTAASSFSPHVQQLRAANAHGKWQLIVHATQTGVKLVKDDLINCAIPNLKPERAFRYTCPICDEGCDSLSDDWLVSLTCGCVLHLECSRFYFSCDEKDSLDSLRPSRLFPLECFLLDSTGKKCGKPLAQLDIHELVKDPEQLQRRAIEELSRFASIPSTGWRMCPVPSCSVSCKMLYRVAQNTQCWSNRKCEGCGFEHCASCEGAPHSHGMSCREAVGDQVSHDPLAGLDPNKYGSCPKCNLLIERAEACSHMICTRCNTNFYITQRNIVNDEP